MKSIRVTTPGGPEALELVDVPTLSPNAGQALVRVEAAGVNYLDVYNRSGVYKAEPSIWIGNEGAGVVEALGSVLRALLTERGATIDG
jgi:NADPH2:quinone reductase